MLGIFPDIRQAGTWWARNVPSTWQAIDHVRSGPSLGRAQRTIIGHCETARTGPVTPDEPAPWIARIFA